MTDMNTIRASAAPRRRPSRKSFASDERGIAAAEFSIIAPVIIALYLGLAEMSFAMSKERQVAHSASVSGDMVAQVPSVTPDEVADILAASLRVSQVGNIEDYVIRISSYAMVPTANGNGSEVQELGHAVYNSGAENLLAPVVPSSFSEEILSETSGVVVANVAFRYRPLGFRKTVGPKEERGTTLLDPTIVMRETFTLKPRRSSTVQIGDGGTSVMLCSGEGNAVACSSPSSTDDDRGNGRGNNGNGDGNGGSNSG